MFEKRLICSECGFDTVNPENMTDHLTFTGHDLTEITLKKMNPKKILSLHQIPRPKKLIKKNK